MSARAHLRSTKASHHHVTSHEELLARLAEAGLADRASAERALRLTLSVLGQRLTDDEALALCACLPEDLARIVEQSEYSDYDGAFDAVELYDRVRRRAKQPAGVVHEQVNIVLAAIGRDLDDDVRRRLVRALPAPIGDMLVPRHLAPPPPHVAPSHAPPLSTLAGGRPGSRHPIAEAGPSRGQTHSVAANDDPHAETKLSSSRGLTQERMRESLATGHPPAPARPLADANEE